MSRFNARAWDKITKRGEMHHHKQHDSNSRDLNIFSVVLEPQSGVKWLPMCGSKDGAECFELESEPMPPWKLDWDYLRYGFATNQLIVNEASQK